MREIDTDVVLQQHDEKERWEGAMIVSELSKEIPAKA
jgi:hypothetical protein